MDANTTESLPGRNHSYQIDVPFYTLRTKDGKFLSHPEAIIHGQWTVLCHTRPPTTVNVATAPDWTCAWVVYRVSELRALRAALAGIKSHNEVPLIPCTGTVIVGRYGMMQCLAIYHLSEADVTRLERREARTGDIPSHHPRDWTQAPERLRRGAPTTMQDTLSKLAKRLG